MRTGRLTKIFTITAALLLAGCTGTTNHATSSSYVPPVVGDGRSRTIDEMTAGVDATLKGALSWSARFTQDPPDDSQADGDGPGRGQHQTDPSPLTRLGAEGVLADDGTASFRLTYTGVPILDIRGGAESGLIGKFDLGTLAVAAIELGMQPSDALLARITHGRKFVAHGGDEPVGGSCGRGPIASQPLLDGEWVDIEGRPARPSTVAMDALTRMAGWDWPQDLDLEHLLGAITVTGTGDYGTGTGHLDLDDPAGPWTQLLALLDAGDETVADDAELRLIFEGDRLVAFESTLRGPAQPQGTLHVSVTSDTPPTVTDVHAAGSVSWTELTTFLTTARPCE